MPLIGSATIPSSSVTNALGFTPLNKAGDTMSGALRLQSLLVPSQTANIRMVRQWEYNTTLNSVANNSSIDLFSNASQYIDLHFILICQGYHSNRSWVLLSGAVGGYGLGATKVGNSAGDQTYSVSYISDGYGKLRFTNASGNIGTFSFSAIILGNSAVTVHNGTIYE